MGGLCLTRPHHPARWCLLRWIRRAMRLLATWVKVRPGLLPSTHPAGSEQRVFPDRSLPGVLAQGFLQAGRSRPMCSPRCGQC